MGETELNFFRSSALACNAVLSRQLDFKLLKPDIKKFVKAQVARMAQTNPNRAFYLDSHWFTGKLEAQTENFSVFSGYKGSDTAYLHELETSQKYSRYLKESNREHFVLLPKYYGIDVPGFDGLIFDEKGKASVNISLKYSRDPSRARKTAVNSIRNFTTNGEGAWISAIGAYFKQFSIQENWRRFGRFVSVIPDLMEIFGIAPQSCRGCIGRKSIIVIEVPEDSPKYDLSKPENILPPTRTVLDNNSDILEGIVYIKGSKVLEVLIGKDHVLVDLK